MKAIKSSVFLRSSFLLSLTYERLFFELAAVKKFLRCVNKGVLRSNCENSSRGSYLLLLRPSSTAYSFRGPLCLEATGFLAAFFAGGDSWYSSAEQSQQVNIENTFRYSYRLRVPFSYYLWLASSLCLSPGSLGKFMWVQICSRKLYCQRHARKSAPCKRKLGCVR